MILKNLARIRIGATAKGFEKETKEQLLRRKPM